MKFSELVTLFEKEIADLDICITECREKAFEFYQRGHDRFADTAQREERDYKEQKKAFKRAILIVRKCLGEHEDVDDEKEEENE